MILVINACVRKDSRTKRLAMALLEKLKEKDPEIQEVRLSEITFPIADEAFLNKRDTWIANEEWSRPLFEFADQFAGADTIVVAAPYWDLSFPAALKQYFEQINVMGITFKYTPEGTPMPLCRAGELYYVTTAGGAFVPDEYGFGYVKTLAQSFYGIQNVHLIKATGFDIYGADVEAIMNDAIRDIRNRF